MNNKENLAQTKEKLRRRSSILKDRVNTNNADSNEEDAGLADFNARRSKRVSFAETNTIKEFLISRGMADDDYYFTYQQQVIYDSSSSGDNTDHSRTSLHGTVTENTSILQKRQTTPEELPPTDPPDEEDDNLKELDRQEAMKFSNLFSSLYDPQDESQLKEQESSKLDFSCVPDTSKGLDETAPIPHSSECFEILTETEDKTSLSPELNILDILKRANKVFEAGPTQDVNANLSTDMMEMTEVNLVPALPVKSNVASGSTQAALLPLSEVQVGSLQPNSEGCHATTYFHGRELPCEPSADALMEMTCAVPVLEESKGPGVDAPESVNPQYSSSPKGMELTCTLPHFMNDAVNESRVSLTKSSCNPVKELKLASNSSDEVGMEITCALPITGKNKIEEIPKAPTRTTHCHSERGVNFSTTLNVDAAMEMTCAVPFEGREMGSTSPKITDLMKNEDAINPYQYDAGMQIRHGVAIPDTLSDDVGMEITCGLPIQEKNEHIFPTSSLNEDRQVGKTGGTYDNYVKKELLTCENYDSPMQLEDTGMEITCSLPIHKNEEEIPKIISESYSNVPNKTCPSTLRDDIGMEITFPIPTYRNNNGGDGPAMPLSCTENANEGLHTTSLPEDVGMEITCALPITRCSVEDHLITSEHGGSEGIDPSTLPDDAKMDFTCAALPVRENLNSHSLSGKEEVRSPVLSEQSIGRISELDSPHVIASDAPDATFAEDPGMELTCQVPPRVEKSPDHSNRSIFRTAKEETSWDSCGVATTNQLEGMGMHMTSAIAAPNINILDASHSHNCTGHSVHATANVDSPDGNKIGLANTADINDTALDMQSELSTPIPNTESINDADSNKIKPHSEHSHCQDDLPHSFYLEHDKELPLADKNSIKEDKLNDFGMQLPNTKLQPGKDFGKKLSGEDMQFNALPRASITQGSSSFPQRKSRPSFKGYVQEFISHKELGKTEMQILHKQESAPSVSPLGTISQSKTNLNATLLHEMNYASLDENHKSSEEIPTITPQDATLNKDCAGPLPDNSKDDIESPKFLEARDAARGDSSTNVTCCRGDGTGQERMESSSAGVSNKDSFESSTIEQLLTAPITNRLSYSDNSASESTSNLHQELSRSSPEPRRINALHCGSRKRTYSNSQKESKSDILASSDFLDCDTKQKQSKLSPNCSLRYTKVNKDNWQQSEPLDANSSEVPHLLRQESNERESSCVKECSPDDLKSSFSLQSPKCKMNDNVHANILLGNVSLDLVDDSLTEPKEVEEVDGDLSMEVSCERIGIAPPLKSSAKTISEDDIRECKEGATMVLEHIGSSGTLGLRSSQNDDNLGSCKMREASKIEEMQMQIDSSAKEAFHTHKDKGQLKSRVQQQSSGSELSALNSGAEKDSASIENSRVSRQNDTFKSPGKRTSESIEPQNTQSNLYFTSPSINNVSGMLDYTLAENQSRFDVDMTDYSVFLQDVSTSTSEDKIMLNKSTIERHGFCNLCFKFTEYEDLCSQSGFSISEFDQSSCQLRLKGRTLKLSLDLSIYEEHLMIVTSFWKPQFQDLKNPIAKLAIHAYQQKISAVTQNLSGQTICQISSHLKDISEVYEATVGFLKEIFSIQSCYLSEIKDHSMEVKLLNTKARIVALIKIRVVALKTYEKLLYPNLQISSKVLFGNMRDSILEDAIKEDTNRGPHRLLSVVKTLDFVIANMKR